MDLSDHGLKNLFYNIKAMEHPVCSAFVFDYRNLLFDDREGLHPLCAVRQSKADIRQKQNCPQ
jgi:hypothetical protein